MRRVMFAGTITMALGFVSYASIGSLWHFWLSSAILAVGLSMVAFVPVQTLISLWFARRRGLAMGLTLAGIGFGGLSLVPLTGAVISAYGWRIAYMSLAVVVVAPVSLILMLVLRDSPAALGLLPDGDPPASKANRVGAGDENTLVVGLDLGEALRTRAFWMLTATVFFSSFASFGLVQHLAALLTDVGYSPAVSARVLGTAIGFSVIGRVLGGTLSDRFGGCYVYAALVALITLATAILLSPNQGFSLIAFTILFGLGLGGINVLLPLLVGTCFGLKSFSRLLGVFILAATLGSSAGPLFVGFLFDMNGNYDAALPVLIVLGILATLMVTFVERTSFSQTVS